MSTIFTSSLVALATLLDASTLVAVDVIRAGDRVTQSNAAPDPESVEPADMGLIGREVRRTVYAGQPITLDNTRPARLVSRNQVVTVKYIKGPLEITTTGRAMGEAALNEPVTVLNLESRQLVHGIVQESGWVLAQ